MCLEICVKNIHIYTYIHACMYTYIHAYIHVTIISEIEAMNLKDHRKGHKKGCWGEERINDEIISKNYFLKRGSCPHSASSNPYF